MVDFALFVEGGYRLPGVLATAGVHSAEPEGLSSGRGAEHLSYKVASVVGLAYDPVCAVFVVKSYSAFGPCVWATCVRSRRRGRSRACRSPLRRRRCRSRRFGGWMRPQGLWQPRLPRGCQVRSRPWSRLSTVSPRGRLQTGREGLRRSPVVLFGCPRSGT